MAGKSCKVIDGFNSGIKVGTVFSSRRDLHRAMPPGEGIKVGYVMEGQAKQLRRGSGRTAWIENYTGTAKLPAGVSLEAAASDVRAPGRTGRTMWKITDAGTTTLPLDIFTSKRDIFRALGRQTGVFKAQDLVTDKMYKFTVNKATYRVEEI